MPRDGANVYHVPSGTTAVTDTTIDSAKYNAFVGDIEQDANTPRPIVAGGTGASSATAAMTNLGGELAKQLVTNYNSQVFQAGSFYSAAGATGAPVAGHAFAGICYVIDADNMVIEARDENDTTTPGHLYVREKKGAAGAGVWGPWTADVLAATNPSIYVSDTPPVGAPVNSLWWKSDVGQLYISYQDADSTQWVQAVAIPSVVVPATVPPLMNGVAAVGASGKYAREDHVHPTDTSLATVASLAAYAPLASPVLTGSPQAPTQPANTNNNTIASTAYADRSSLNALNSYGHSGTGTLVHTNAPVITNAVANLYTMNSAGASASNTCAYRIYDLGGNNWAGMGADSSGNRVNVSGGGDHYWGKPDVAPFMHLVNGGTLFVSGTYQTSDARLKTNVQTLEPSPYFDELRPVSFDWIDSAKGVNVQYGLIAQEVEPLAPELVTEDLGYLHINYQNLIAELITQVQSLKARVATLEGAA